MGRLRKLSDQLRSALRSLGPAESVAVVLLAAALAGRILLVAHAPSFRGFYYDDCWPPIRDLARTWTLPAHDACWQCYQPPAVYVAAACGLAAATALGAPMAAARWAPLLLNLVLGLVLVGAACALPLRMSRVPRSASMAAAAVVAAVPIAAIAAVGVNVDVAPNAAMVVMTLMLVRAHGHRRSIWWWAGMGVMVGLAAASKYTGLIAALVLVQLGLLLALARRRELWSRRGIALALVVASAVAAPVYLRNLVETGRLMPGNRGNDQAFSLAALDRRHVAELLRLPLVALLRSPFTAPEEPGLQRQPYYRAPLTAFYGTFWTELGFFSRPGVSVSYRFPARAVPPVLSFLVLLLGFPVTILAGVGAIRCMSWDVVPAHLMAVNHLLLAALYRLAGGPWFTKAIYNLAVLGPFALYVACGLWAASRRSPALGVASRWMVLAQAAACVTWLVLFAVG